MSKRHNSPFKREQAYAMTAEEGIPHVAGLHLISAFLAMEPTRCLISHARYVMGSARFVCSFFFFFLETVLC